MSEPIHAQLIIEIAEVDARQAVPVNLHDDEGNETGPNLNYDRDIEVVKDMTFFGSGLL